MRQTDNKLSGPPALVHGYLPCQYYRLEFKRQYTTNYLGFVS